MSRFLWLSIFLLELAMAHDAMAQRYFRAKSQFDELFADIARARVLQVTPTVTILPPVDDYLYGDIIRGSTGPLYIQSVTEWAQIWPVLAEYLPIDVSGEGIIEVTHSIEDGIASWIIGAATATPQPTSTPQPTPTIRPTDTPIATATPPPGVPPTATAIATPTPWSIQGDGIATVIPGATTVTVSVQSATPQPTATVRPTDTPQPTPTPAKTAVPTATARPTDTPAPTPVATATARPTSTPLAIHPVGNIMTSWSINGVTVTVPTPAPTMIVSASGPSIIVTNNGTEWLLEEGASSDLGGRYQETITSPTTVVYVNHPLGFQDVYVGVRDAATNQVITPALVLPTTDQVRIGFSSAPPNPIEVVVIAGGNGNGASEGVTDHGSLTGLADNDHPQYMTWAIAGTVTAVHTFSPSVPGAPFILGINADGQIVDGLNSDEWNGWDTLTVTGNGELQTGINGAIVVIYTPVPTATAVPTGTPQPTATPGVPTATARPTDTPIPTATVRPTDTPIPAPTPQQTPTPFNVTGSGLASVTQVPSGFNVEVPTLRPTATPFADDQFFVFGDGVNTVYTWHSPDAGEYPIVRVRENRPPYRGVQCAVTVPSAGVIQIGLSSPPEQSSLIAYYVVPDVYSTESTVVHALGSDALIFSCYNSSRQQVIAPVQIIDNNTVVVQAPVSVLSIARLPNSVYLADESTRVVEHWQNDRNVIVNVVYSGENMPSFASLFDRQSFTVAASNPSGATVAWKHLRWGNFDQEIVAHPTPLPTPTPWGVQGGVNITVADIGVDSEGVQQYLIYDARPTATPFIGDPGDIVTVNSSSKPQGSGRTLSDYIDVEGLNWDNVSSYTTHGRSWINFEMANLDVTGIININDLLQFKTTPGLQPTIYANGSLLFDVVDDVIIANSQALRFYPNSTGTKIDFFDGAYTISLEPFTFVFESDEDFAWRLDTGETLATLNAAGEFSSNVGVFDYIKLNQVYTETEALSLPSGALFILDATETLIGFKASDGTLQPGRSYTMSEIVASATLSDITHYQYLGVDLPVAGRRYLAFYKP